MRVWWACLSKKALILSLSKGEVGYASVGAKS